MIAEWGAVLLAFATLASLGQGAAGLWAGHRNAEALAAAARALAASAFLAFGLSFAALTWAFLTSDFSVALVANHSHVAKPLIYKISGVWGNHQGSMLMWCLVSAGFAFAIARLRGGLSFGLWSRAVGVQGLVTAAVGIYTLVLSSPFERLDPAPIQGQDLNPLLQDPALAAHPPLLYLGYVGLSVPFSLAIAALLDGKTDQAWARALRPWTLIAWTCLTLGIGLGSYWAYYELGWGGWWFWDPVENASFMPWLAGAALLHSAIVTERRGSLGGWTILLAIIGFGLALLGTFLVRSGVLTSVHAFAVDPARGYALLILLAGFIGGGFALYAWRAERLGKSTGFAAVSRESLLVLNNVGLSIAAATVLVGTLYPIVYALETGRSLSVGPPFFNLTFSPLMAALLVVVPFAPLLAWRKGDLGKAWKALWMAALVAGALAAGLSLVYAGGVFQALGFIVGAWLVTGGLAYLWKRAGDGDGGASRRWRKLIALPLAAYAMSGAHIGVGVFTLGASAESGSRIERTAMLSIGESVAFADRTITLARMARVEGPNYEGERAILTVAQTGGPTREMSAERRFYPAAGRPTTEVGILSGLSGDFYVALGELDPQSEKWAVRMYHKPLVYLIYWGVTLMAFGGLLGLLALALRRVTAPSGQAKQPQPAPVSPEPSPSPSTPTQQAAP
jgi:cytochrome c-type biogenesis protein CcmF